MKTKLTLVNSNAIWDEKRRYKVNTLVSHNSFDWQNATGINTEPGVDGNWVKVSGGSGAGTTPINLRSQYNGSSVTVPNGFVLTRVASQNDINTSYAGVVTGTSLVITAGVSQDIYLIDGYVPS